VDATHTPLSQSSAGLSQDRIDFFLRNLPLPHLGIKFSLYRRLDLIASHSPQAATIDINRSIALDGSQALKKCTLRADEVIDFHHARARLSYGILE
jgi:hypothetical protein